MTSPIESNYTRPAQLTPRAINFSAPNLARHPPRSPRTRLGGYVHLPRLLDKARAVALGQNGAYHYPCPFDQRFLSFLGISADAVMTEVRAGRSDREILAFIQENASSKRHPSEIASWSDWLEQLAPTSTESRAFFNAVHQKNAPDRDDIGTWFDWLELDDFVTFGGRP